MAAKQLTRLEQTGILAGIIIIALFCYLKFVNEDPGRKLRRTEKELKKISMEVKNLRQQEKSGSVKRALRKLRKEIPVAERKLEKMEERLVRPAIADELANEIIRCAAKGGLKINEFSHITDKSLIKKLRRGENFYKNAFYKLSLQGRFGRFRALVDEVVEMPYLGVLRKIKIEKKEEDKYMQAELWFSL